MNNFKTEVPNCLVEVSEEVGDLQLGDIAPILLLPRQSSHLLREPQVRS